ncbi:MAG: recombinase family protein [Defluviitaleaceae bacterium]|nr:recombinase family protein [Defluviitaleaceae bacterium]
MEQYCMYLRKSRQDNEAESRGEGETLARHRKALTELARSRNLCITKVYEEVVSGETISARPQMQGLLADVETGVWAGVLVMEVERLARGDTSDQGTVAKTFQYSQTRIVTPLKTFDPRDEFDEEYFEYSLFMSRREYKIINRRMQRGRLASVKEGKYVANRPPYGYARKRLEACRGWTLEPVPEQAEVVRLIFELYTAGEVQPDGSCKRLGVGLVAARLNGLGIAAKKGGLWVGASVRDILLNPVYIGKLRWNRRPTVKRMVGGEIRTARPRTDAPHCIVVDGLHDGIVDEAVFAAAQEVMTKNPPRPIAHGEGVKNPLGGLVFCGMCGRSMVRRPHKRRNYPDTLMCAVPECGNVSAGLDRVEAKLLETLEGWLGGYELRFGEDTSRGHAGEAACRTEMRRKAAERLTAEIATLRKQQGRAHDLLEQGVYDAETFAARMADVSSRITAAEGERNAMETLPPPEDPRKAGRAALMPQTAGIIETYRALTTAQAKNDLMKSVLAKVVYVKHHAGRGRTPPDGFELTIYPTLPPRTCTQ